jgi:hypothetical protein
MNDHDYDGRGGCAPNCRMCQLKQWQSRAEAAEARVRALEEHLDAVIVKWRERGHPPKPRGWMHRITIPEVLQCADELQAVLTQGVPVRREPERE